VHYQAASGSAFDKDQVIVSPVNNAEFGHDISVSRDNRWMYVGAPAADSVFVYALDQQVPTESQLTSVNDQYELTLSGPITAVAGDLLTQTAVGAVFVVQANVTNSATVFVDTFTNISEAEEIVIVPQSDPQNPVSTGETPVTYINTAVVTEIEITEFVPYRDDDAAALIVSTALRTYLPDVDYTLSGTTLTFAQPVSAGSINIIQKPVYVLIDQLTGEVGSRFGESLITTPDGAQLIIGAPQETVDLLEIAGKGYTYDRSIESFISGIGDTYTTTNPLTAVTKVTINGIETSRYLITGTNAITLISPPPKGTVITIESNQFDLLQTITMPEVQKLARFGAAVTACATGCAYYVGAPFYDAVDSFNSGAVAKYHNNPKLYGELLTINQDPVLTAGGSIRINGFEIVATGVNVTSLAEQINQVEAIGAVATVEQGRLRLRSTLTTEQNLMSVSVGQGALFDELGIEIFKNIQVITNPLGQEQEYFGVGL